MPENDPSVVRDLRTAAYIVVVAWGIRSTSETLSVILIALLLAYTVLPFPSWLMHRFGFRRTAAIVLTVGFMAVTYLVLGVALADVGFRMYEKMPVYEQHFRSMYGQLAGYLSAHGMDSALNSLQNLSGPEEIVRFARMVFPKAMGLLSDRILVSLLSVLFLFEMANPQEVQANALARHLAHYGKDIQRFISITAQTGAINALANLVVLVLLGVDFPIFWCVLYFFLHFIPNVGFLIALVPPTLVALLMLGWKRALLVAGGLILTQMIVDYTITPMLMTRGLHISFLEITLSLMVWGFLLGPTGVILAIPMTMALKKFIGDRSLEGRHA